MSNDLSSIYGPTLEGKVAEIVEDGKKAVFKVDGKPLFMLYLSDDGKWTFHL